MAFEFGLHSSCVGVEAGPTTVPNESIQTRTCRMSKHWLSSMRSKGTVDLPPSTSPCGGGTIAGGRVQSGTSDCSPRPVIGGKSRIY